MSEYEDRIKRWTGRFDLDQLTEDHDKLHMMHCCYWKYLEGVAVPNIDKPSIRISTGNIFDAAALTKILNQIEGGESLNGV